MIKNPTVEMTDEKHLPQANVPFDQIAKDLVRTTTHGGKTIMRVSIILGVFSIVGIVALIVKLITQGDDSTQWGYVAALVSFLLTVGGGAPMVAIAPVLAKANWVRPITRISAIFSLTGIATLIMTIPLLVMLPPLVVDGTRRRSIWFEGPIFSPHVWDYIGILGLIITGLALFYTAAIPDFAVMRDHTTGWRKRVGRILSRGWVGSNSQWRTLRMRIGMFGTFYFLILIFVHFLFSSDFAMGIVPGWRDAIFPMYHSITSLQGGLAAVIASLWFIRRYFKLEKYIHIDQFWSLSRLLFATTLLWIYFFYSAFIVFWYGRGGADKAWIDLLVRGSKEGIGPMGWVFIFAGIFIFIAPWWWLIWNSVRRSINGPIIAASLILIGIMLDRVRIFVTAWSVPTEHIHDKYLMIIPQTSLPSGLDIMIIIGGICLGLLPILVISRVIPVVSIWEMQQFNLLSKPVKYMKTHGVLVAKPD